VACPPRRSEAIGYRVLVTVILCTSLIFVSENTRRTFRLCTIIIFGISRLSFAKAIELSIGRMAVEPRALHRPGYFKSSEYEREARLVPRRMKCCQQLEVVKLALVRASQRPLVPFEFRAGPFWRTLSAKKPAICEAPDGGSGYGPGESIERPTLIPFRGSKFGGRLTSQTAMAVLEVSYEVALMKREDFGSKTIIVRNQSMKVRARTHTTVALGSVFFMASVPAFYSQVFGTGAASSDIPDHFSATTSGVRYSILSLLVAGLWWIGANATVIGWIAVALLSAFVAFKGTLSFCLLSEDSKSLILPSGVALFLAFAMPIVNWWNYENVYLGQIAPNVWHNSTTIVAMPAVALLFYAGLRSLEEPVFKNMASTAALGLITVLIKPNYAIAWLPVFVPWFSVRAYMKDASKRHILNQLVLVIGPLIVVLLIQSLLVYNGNSRIIVAPLGVWTLYSPHPSLSLLLSLAFPLAVLILYWRSLVRDKSVLFAWVVFAVALLQFILLAEAGPRFSDGNFAWGVYMALYLLFLASANLLLRQPISIRSVSAFGFLGLHFGSGLYYYWRIVKGLGFA
jgi:hypothetical protein